MSFTLLRKRDQHKTPSHVLAETERIEYFGSIPISSAHSQRFVKREENKAPMTGGRTSDSKSSKRYLLGIFDRESGKVRLVEAPPIVAMEQHVKGTNLFSSTSSRSSDYALQRRALTDEFGSKKDRLKVFFPFFSSLLPSSLLPSFPWLPHHSPLKYKFKRLNKFWITRRSPPVNGRLIISGNPSISALRKSVFPTKV